MARSKESIERARALWQHRGAARPSFAVEPGPDQESVWDYPRPPQLEPDTRIVVPGRGASLCEWKGRAVYWSLRIEGELVENVAWSYPEPFEEFDSIRSYGPFKGDPGTGGW